MGPIPSKSLKIILAKAKYQLHSLDFSVLQMQSYYGGRALLFFKSLGSGESAKRNRKQQKEAWLQGHP